MRTSAACLELTLGRAAVRFVTGATVALAGAAAPMRLTVPAAASRQGSGDAGTQRSGDTAGPDATEDDTVWQPTPGTAFSVPAGADTADRAATGGAAQLPGGRRRNRRSAGARQPVGRQPFWPWPAALRPGTRLALGAPRSLPGSRTRRRAARCRAAAAHARHDR